MVDQSASGVHPEPSPTIAQSADGLPFAMPDAPAQARLGFVEVVSTGLVTLFTVFAILFFTGVLRDSAVTPDVSWLLRLGQYILDTGHLPTTDIFSWTHANQEVVIYQWLFAVALAGIERLIGEAGLFAVFVPAAVGIYLLAPLFGAVPRRIPTALTIGTAGLGLAIVTINLSIRPMIVTSAMLLLQYALVQRFRRGDLGLRVAVCLAGPAYAVWANAHNGVVLGLASLVLSALGDFAERRQLYRFDPADPQIEGRPAGPAAYASLFLAGFLGSLINPYGFGVYAHLVDFSSQAFLADVISELRTADFHQLQFRLFLVLIAGLLLTLTRLHRTVSAGDLLQLAAFTVATLIANRFVVWAVLLYILILPRALHHLASVPAITPRNTWAVLVRSSDVTRRYAGWAAVGFLLCLPIALGQSPQALMDKCDYLRPALAAYARERLPNDRLLTSDIVGSCAIGESTRPLVFFDTRFDFYGESFSKEVIEALRLRPGWQQLLEKWDIDVVVLDKDWPMAQALPLLSGYAVRYEDDYALVARREPND